MAKLAGKPGTTIMREPYPVPDMKKADSTAIDEMHWVMGVITSVRNIRGEMDIPPGKRLPLLVQDGTARDRKYLDSNRHYLETLARAESISWLEKGTDAPESATALVSHLKILIPLGLLIDKNQELERLGKEMEKIERDLSKAKTKLANPEFVDRAPKNVVEQENQRVLRFETTLSKLRAQCAKVKALPG
jgi:valyl-tRNA synthetase